MNERRKGAESFYAPFLNILPEPGSASLWAQDQLQQLQDEQLLLRAKNKKRSLEGLYLRTLPPLCEKYPHLFTLEEFPFEEFRFAWHCVQARAFGRRLPWTAMVPFADCLNHSNVQTKYDYNVNDNGLFRLFPSGKNSYPKGSEVFNSYGKRANENLLLDYGFALLDNEWDQVDVTFTLPRSDTAYSRKERLLFGLGFQSAKIFSLQKGASNFPLDALSYLRVICLTEQELEYVDNALEVTPSQLLSSSSSPSSLAVWFHDTIGQTLPPAPPSSSSAAAGGGSPRRRPNLSRIICVRNELHAVRLFLGMLRGLVESRDTSAAEDEELLEVLQNPTIAASAAAAEDGDTSDENWRALCAVTYRLTRKRIVDHSILVLCVLEDHFRGLLQVDRTGRDAGGSDAAELRGKLQSVFGQVDLGPKFSRYILHACACEDMPLEIV